MAGVWADNLGANSMQTYRTFATLPEARDYRQAHGTGGWIFVPDNGDVILFPPDHTPSGIFHHELTKGKSGKLYAYA